MNDVEFEIFDRKKDYAKNNLKVKLDEDDIARICHQCGFDEAKIDVKLSQYKTNNKYEGLEEFEW